MLYPILPVSAFIGAVLLLIPLPSHWRARNHATLSLVFWLFTMDIVYGVNSIVWGDNIRLHLLVWCDITTKLVIGASVALPASALCVCKHLELVASGRVGNVTVDGKRRRMLFELVMCYLLPVVIMALHYVVQGHRFNLMDVFGCQPTTYYSSVGILIVWFPPLLLATISIVYASLALYHFVRHRFTFATVLAQSSSSITANRYLRLMAMALTVIAWQVILTVLPLYDNNKNMQGLRPWTGWADVHSNWNRVDRFPFLLVPPTMRAHLFLYFAAMPVSSLLFFLFFGLGEEAMKDYRKTGAWIREKVFRRPAPAQSKLRALRLSGSTSQVKGGIPVFTIPHFKANEDAELPAYSPGSEGRRFASSQEAASKARPAMVGASIHEAGASRSQTDSSYTAVDDAGLGFGSYRALPSATTVSTPTTLSRYGSVPSLPLPLPLPPLSLSRPSSATPRPAPPSPLSTQTSSLRAPSVDTPFSLTPPATAPAFPSRPSSAPPSTLSPADSRFSGLSSPVDSRFSYGSPTDSRFSRLSDASSIDVRALEAVYGARMPSFTTLEIDVTSLPPTPVVGRYGH